MGYKTGYNAGYRNGVIDTYIKLRRINGMSKWNDPEFMELFNECHENEWREEEYDRKYGYEEEDEEESEWIIVRNGITRCPECGNFGHEIHNYCAFCGVRMSNAKPL